MSQDIIKFVDSNENQKIMIKSLPIWHVVEPLEKDQTRFVVVNLETDELALPIIESPQLAIKHAHALLAVSRSGDDVPYELIEAAKRGAVTAVLRNDVASAKIALNDIVHVFTRESYVGIDFEDMRIIVASSTNCSTPNAVAGSGVAQEYSAWENALNTAVQCAELERPNCLKRSGGVLMIISASQHMHQLTTNRHIVNAMRQKLDPEAHFIFGVNFDESIGEAIRITVLVAV
jgi:FtsZ family, C-terminal domain